MRTTIALTFAAALAALASPAGAASFDCAKAKAPDEVAICANPDLSALDSEMGGLWFAYDQFPFLMGANGSRQDEARQFLDVRAACGADVSCLKGAYAVRNATLKQQINMAMDQYCSPQ
ncbi:MAG: hypothetical protein KDK07_06545 [Bauldia sp.]|nr:hypothetical protein [Bauldia sp.]